MNKTMPLVCLPAVVEFFDEQTALVSLADLLPAQHVIFWPVRCRS